VQLQGGAQCSAGNEADARANGGRRRWRHCRRRPGLLHLPGCLGGSTSPDASAEAERTEHPAATAPAPTTPPATAPPATTQPVDPAVEQFVHDCVDYVGFKIQIGDAAYTAAWGALDAAGIEAQCRQTAADPAAAATMQGEIVQLQQFFEAAKAAEATTTTTPATTTPPTPPPPPPPGPAPVIRISCPTPQMAPADTVRVDFGYTYYATSPQLVEWGMDYGDGHHDTSTDEATARNRVFWHRYRSPGAYHATAWVVDAIGRRATASCDWPWYPSSRHPTSPPIVSDDEPTYGDLDCEDIGEEVWVGDDDPNHLDGDGDGWGCESYG
jgi:hypothetical protein